ncbi:HAD family phosphatase [Tuanshanicoccus lijuaniae]|uniref:HAD-IIB family hydrolase n=1 Tax=Aerococcaceae bacterium zg-1292 TaxID=2774330 RepID=UPI0019368109|nr:HAD family phosphatase [Aerococcaceae bacterium zg-1292]MBF6625051.1 HAD family phosphatase [Aerococcaceae bacterium zg-BR9]MBF6978169.1 HAD family phosphatase [Aerococcaceae bacterium zg-BR22]QQA37543.1 HAD family phosphatase [Aerococcaceae bacterium zg-1292]
MIKLICIDMDQTLLRRDKSYDRERFVAVLPKLMALGMTVCIASGNSYHKLIEFFDENAQEKLYFAGDNGNYVIVNRDVKRVVGIDKALAVQLANYFDAMDGYYLNMSTGMTTYFRETSGPAYDKVMRYNNQVEHLDSFDELPDEEKVAKIAIYSRHTLAKNKAVVRTVREQFPDISIVTSGDEWVDIYHGHGGKGKAVAWLQQHLNVSKEETMVFGDSLNDETMMNEAKYSIAMANADHDLVLHSHYQIGDNESQAVLDVLERLVDDAEASFMTQYLLKR